MNKEIFNLLVKAGLTEMEASVYLTGLELGPISMAKLATKVGISRQTAYEAIKKLESKELATTNQKEYGK
jgi:sugar-specific transcriptional regulator TrmB